MGAPFTPMPGYPPEDLGPIESPQANWQAAGKQLMDGLLLSVRSRQEKLWGPLTKPKAGKFEWDWSNPAASLGQLFLDGLGQLFIWFFEVVDAAFVWLAKRMIEAKAAGDTTYDDLVSMAIYDLLDVKINIGQEGGTFGKGEKASRAKTIGDAIMQGLFGPWKGGTAGSLRPSAEPAERLVTSSVRLAFEGWVWKLFSEVKSLGMLEDFGELDDKLQGALGLGRTVRRCIQPLADATIMTPLSWKVNQIFRPTRPGTAEAIRQYLRGRWSMEKLYQELAKDGYSDEDIANLLGTHQRFLGDSDVQWLLQHKLWTQEQALQHMQDSGYSEGTARTLLATNKEQALDSFRHREADAALDAYVDRRIEEGQLERILVTTGLPEEVRYRYKRLAGLRRELHRRELSLGQMQEAVQRGIRPLNDFRRWALEMGYTFEDAQTLEMLLLSDVQDRKAAEEARKRHAAELEAARQARIEEQRQKREEAAAAAALKGESIPEYEALVRRGRRSMEQFRAWLKSHGYADAVVQDLAELLTAEIQDAAAAQQRHDELAAEARKRHVNLGELERAVRLRLMSVDEYRSQLATMGYEQADRDLLAAMLQQELDAAAAAEKRRQEAADKLAHKEVSLDDLERMVRLGYRTVAQYGARLQAEGFSAEDVETLSQMLRDEMAADDAARKRREEIAKALAKRKLSLAQMEDAVRGGLQTLAQFRGELVREGYGEADADLLARLLQLHMDQVKAQEAARKKAAELAAQQHLALGDMERAVELGIVSIQQYKAWLGRAGFGADDRDVLVAIAFERLSEMRQRERQAKERLAAARKRGVSAAEMERAVRAGLRSMAEYAAWLRGQGFAAADVALLTAVLQAQMDADAAAVRRREEIAAAAASRGLSLAQEERAVKEGLRTVAQYAQWLADQGYDDADVAVLVALLRGELERAAAPRPGATTKG